MTRNISILVAVSGLGAGLVHLAVGAGSPLPFFLFFVAVGAAELAWAVAIFIRGRIPAPVAFVAVTLAPVVVWAGSVAVGLAGALPLGPLAAASLLSVAMAGVTLFSLRRRSPLVSATATASNPASADTAEHPWRFIGTLVAASAIVAAIVTPALSGTHAGQYAVPHGTHGVPGLEITEEHSGH